ncbi:MAG: hypothetical protein AAF927_31440 [Bacteroidota bacterium]
MPRPYDRLEGFIHHAIQYVAILGQAYTPQQADDSHTNMCWNVNQQAFTGHPIQGPTDFIPAFFPADFSLRLLTHDAQTLVSIKLSELTFAQGLSSLKQRLAAMGFEEEKLQPISHYEIPLGPMGEMGKFEQPDPALLKHWSYERSEAQKAIEAVSTAAKFKSSVQTWPHHFDAGIYEILDIPHAAGGHGLGLGWSVRDKVANEPYFYVYLWQEKGAIDYASLAPLSVGHWSDGDWKGAYLGASEAFPAGAEKPQEAIQTFLLEAKATLLSAI